MGIEDLASDDVLAQPEGGGQYRHIDSRIAAAFMEATIDSTPASTDEGVMVIIESFHPERQHGPCPWSARIIDEGNFGTPSKGDRALVIVSEEGEPWVIAWWPYD